MELMSPLLLCALVAFLPQALGKSRAQSLSHETASNNTVFIRRNPTIGKISLNKNASSKFNKTRDLQPLHTNLNCNRCYYCIKKAIKAREMRNYIMGPIISGANFQNDLKSEGKRREKRKTEIENNEPRMKEKKTKKSKSKKNKTVTINRYNNGEKIYALKIKETNIILDRYNKSKAVTTCEVYRVEKSLPCESPEADLIITESKKKRNKKGKKGHGKRETIPIELRTTVIAPEFRKRHIDNSQVPEQIMPSIEEMY